MKWSTPDEISGLVRDGMRVGVGGFWFVRNPATLVDAVLASGAKDLEVVCFGGGLPIERLLAAGVVRTLRFSFHSMDVLGVAPVFRAVVESGELEAIEMTTHSLAKALQAVEENLPFLPIRGPMDSAFVGEDTALRVFESPIGGERLVAVPALPLDIALIHATSADRAGNVEIAGPLGLDVRLMGAARSRVASVEEVAESFAGGTNAHRTAIPRFLVDHVVEAPRGAWPGSCLPHYETDLDAVKDALALDRAERESLAPTASIALANSSAPSGSVTRRDAGVPQGQSDQGGVTLAESLVIRLANQIRDDGIYTVGSVTPVAMVAYQLAKHTHAPNAAIIPFAGLVDVSPYAVGVKSAEIRAWTSATAFWGMDDLYDRLYSAGRIDAEIFCPAQIDGQGRINNSWVSREDGHGIRLPGQAGIADVALLHRNLYMYVPRHSVRRLVQTLDHQGGSRRLLGDDERREAGLTPGRVTVVTNLCEFELDPRSRRLEVVSLHPGVDLNDVRGATGFDIAPGNVPSSPPPNPDLLTLLRDKVDPMGVRNLETVASRDRGELLERILDVERTSTRDRT